tara:strand:+ start:82 stop:267 length:186 start_codon:yes stop_codon:yes gene_type:complete
MKKIVLLLTFLIFACSGGDDKNSLTELNLKGKVESVYTTSFTATELLVITGLKFKKFVILK